MENLDLQEIRGQLDGIDSQLVELFERRMKLCGDVAEYKIGTGKPVYDGAREKEKLETVTGMAHGDFNRQGVYELFSQIMTISRRLQYGLLAGHGQRLDTGFTMVEVEEGRADYAVLPIENSSAGAVSGNYDNLVMHNLYIVAETQVSVNHALLGLKGASISDIRRVYSHPQALMQCSRYLNANRQWTQFSVENTAGAAKKIVEDQDIAQAAVASETAGKLYGLQVLEHGINHDKDNTTRFIILSKSPVYRQGAGKVSICFEGLHKSGSLYNMLGNLIYNNVNMLMIESRPIVGRSWEYRFFVDVEGSLGDAAIQNALKGISEEAVSMRILGNY